MPSTPARAASGMAGNSQVDLSFERILQILAEIPVERLKDYRGRLSSLPPDDSSRSLLHVLILWRLGEKDEAGMRLSGLRDNVAAAHLYECCWGNRIPPLSQKPERRVAQAVAEIYSLLVDEKLWEPLASGSTEAIPAFQASSTQGIQFASPLDEAVDKQGLPFSSLAPRSRWAAPCLSRGQSAQLRSDLVPIEGSRPSDFPHPLRSRESPISFLSSFEISEDSKIFSTDELCRAAAGLLAPTQAEETSQGLLAGGCSGSPNEQNPGASEPPDAAPLRPPRCTPTPSVAAPELPPPAGPLPSPPDPQPFPQQPGMGGFAGATSTSGTNFFAPNQSADRSTISPLDGSPGVSLVALEDKKQFYTFVVLHAKEDGPIACRVKDRLESLGVSNGAVFSHDFLVAGHGQLWCFQDALDNSAFTLLLLTKNFKGQLCSYQRDTALMDSFSRLCKRDSVIPFVPKESSSRPEEMPLLLASLVPLCEDCPTFARKVAKTFTAKRILEKKKAWIIRQKILEKKQQHEQRQEYLRMQQLLSDLSLQPAAAAPPVDFPQCPGPFGPAPPRFPDPSMPLMQPGPDQASLRQPLLFSMGCPSITPSGGPAPQLIIQNAQMVQIGDYNHMRVEKTEGGGGLVDGAPQREGGD